MSLKTEDSACSEENNFACWKMEEFTILRTIGRGSYAQILAAQRGDNIYAIKKALIRKSRVNEHGNSERNVLEKTNHPFLIKMIEYFPTPYHFCYVLEYAPGGDLYNYLHSIPKLSKESAQFYATEIAIAIAYLHSEGLIHRDIKLKNILLDKDGHIKLTDFGLTVHLDKEGPLNSKSGTKFYMAPEVRYCQNYSYAIDWWSFGVCLYLMLYGCPPSQNFVIANTLLQKIPYPPTISKDSRSLLRGLLEINPEDRLGKAGIEEIRSHAFFAKVDWDKFEAKEVVPPFVPQLDNKTDFRYFEDICTSFKPKQPSSSESSSQDSE